MEKLRDSYDAVVIGAGIGGLTSGALLAKKGLEVLIAEQSERPGGYCTSIKSNGFSFDPAVSILEGCDEGGVIFQTLSDLNVKDELGLIRLEKLAQIRGTEFNLTVNRHLEGFQDELKRLSPKESENIDSFMAECAALYQEMALISKGSSDLMGLGQKIGFIKNFLLKCPRLRKYSGKSTKEVLLDFFSDPTIQVALQGLALFLHPNSQATILMNLIGMMSREDVFYPKKDGIQALPNILVKALERDGGKLALNTRVRKILLEGKKAAGIELENGSRIEAKCIISNIDGKQTFLELIGRENLPAKFVRELEMSKIYNSVMSICLGVNIDLEALGLSASEVSWCPTIDINELFSTDPGNCGLSIRLHSRLDSAQAPAGKSAVGIVASLPYDYQDSWRRKKDGTYGKVYEDLKESLAKKIIFSAEEVIPDLSKNIEQKLVVTPIDLERMTLNSKGSAMGWYPLPGGKIRSQKTPIKNLYQAGHWTFPGGSVPAVTASGRNAAQLVLKNIR